MPESPEVVVFARDMREELAGRTISAVEVLQPKCLNVSYICPACQRSS